MRAKPLVLAVAAIALTGLSSVLAAGKEHVLVGTYESHYAEESGEVRAVFTARAGGEGVARWDVLFYATFDALEFRFRGTAEGSLSEGLLSGRVQDRKKERVFVFRGEHRDKQFRATHFELLGDREEETGTIVLGGEGETADGGK